MARLPNAAWRLQQLRGALAASGRPVGDRPVTLDPGSLERGEVVVWQEMRLRYLGMIAPAQKIVDLNLFGYVFEDLTPGPNRYLTVSQTRAAVREGSE